MQWKPFGGPFLVQKCCVFYNVSWRPGAVLATPPGPKIAPELFQNLGHVCSGSKSEAKLVSTPILIYFFFDIQAAVERKILQNAVRGVRNGTSRMCNIKAIEDALSASFGFQNGPLRELKSLHF